jgi:hypothetical protein
MPNAWVAVDAGTDPVPWARLLRRAYYSAASGGTPASILRPMIVESWRRSEAAGVDPDTPAPLAMDVNQALHGFEEHPLRSVLSHLEQILVSVSRCAGQVVAVADASGLVLWTSGDTTVACPAKRAHLTPGAMWNEAEAGTNAIGTALELDHAVQVFSAEHFKQPLHGWSSAAAPVHDPQTKRILGAVSLSGPLKAAHPHGFSVVLAAARLAEAELEHCAARRNEQLKVAFLERVLRGCRPPCAVVDATGRVVHSTPTGWLRGRLHLNLDGSFAREPREALILEPLEAGAGFLVRRACDDDPAAKVGLEIRALGQDRVTGIVGRQELRLTQRHSEIVVILALHPQGLSDNELMLALYGKTCSPVTIRAEISRLRKVFGALVETHPYRLGMDVCADFLEVERLLAADDRIAAGQRYRGPLLPWSTAPAIVAERRRLECLVLSAIGHPTTGRAAAPATPPERLDQPRTRRLSGS